jgi:GNAT superfamily N-acetyltransferase
MKIRKFIPEDAKELSTVMRAAVRISNSDDYPPKVIQILCDAYSPEKLLRSARRCHLFVAGEGEKIVGTITLMQNRISRMFVDPKQQRKGIGKKLIQHVERFARKLGLKELKVRASLTAFEFYQKCGYKKTRRASNKFVGPIIWMKKDI